MSPSSSFVSVVAIVGNDAPYLEPFAADVLRLLAQHYSHYELVLVDDGSTDETPEVIDRLLKRHECVRMIRLSRRFGTDIAVTAGLDTSIGDYAVVTVVASDPPAKIPEMVALARQGNDIVIGTCELYRRSWPMRTARRAFFRAFRTLTTFQLPENAATMRLFSRQALNALTRIRQKTVHARLLGCSVGFRAATLPYAPVRRETPRLARPWTEALGEAVSILVTTSPAPLRLVSCVGVMASALNVLYMVYVAGVHLWKEKVAEGWTTLSLQMSVMFLFLFSTLVVISEYLVHTFEEVKDRPLYHVADERTSSTALADAQKRNVCTASRDDHDAAPLSDRHAA